MPDPRTRYNDYRDYDPQTGRYVESDPVGLAAGVNTYAYAGDGPTEGIDPWGLDWIEYTGQSLNWYGGRFGDRSRVIHQCPATSGGGAFQHPEFAGTSDGGPVPEGQYRINLTLNPSRVTQFDIAVVILSR